MITFIVNFAKSFMPDGTKTSTSNLDDSTESSTASTENVIHQKLPFNIESDTISGNYFPSNADGHLIYYNVWKVS